MSEQKQARMPVWFLSHGGGPCFWMDEHEMPGGLGKALGKNSASAKWLRSLVATSKIPKPKAIVVASAHWEGPKVLVTSQAKHVSLYYDYYGFPQYTYEIKWPAPGSPELAKKIVGLVTAAGFEAEEDKKRNFDHGVFVPLGQVFPDADIPVVQVSLLDSLDPQKHVELGKALAPLRDEGVLIVGSGYATHNLRVMMNPQASKSAATQAKQFVETLTKAVTTQTGAEREKALAGWAKFPHARLAHPREEHLIPVHVCAGAGGDDQGKVMSDIWHESAAFTSYSFGASE